MVYFYSIFYKRYFDMSMKVFVVVCSGLIIVGFFTSCYLMTTVNPAPIVTTDKLIARDREFVFDFENIHDKDIFREAHYGLEKAPSSPETPAPLPYLFRKNNPDLLSIRKVSNQRTAYPPNQLSLYAHLHPTRTNPMMVPLPNTTLPYTCQHTSKQSQVTESSINKTGNNTDHVKISQPVKGRRRSIDSLQKRFDEISGSVLLKIVDEHGKSRIEIKVNTEDTKTFRNKNSSIGNNSALVTDDTPQDLLISLDELPDRTEIRILPNATLVVSDVSEEFESQLDISTENSFPKAQTNQHNAKHTSKYDVVKGRNDTLAVISQPGSNGPTAAMTVALSNTNHNIKKKYDVVKGRNHTLAVISQLGSNGPTAAMTVALSNANHDIQRTTQTVKQLFKATSTEDFALKVRFDNVTRSFNRET